MFRTSGKPTQHKTWTLLDLLMRLQVKDQTAWYAENEFHVGCIINFLDCLKEEESNE